MKFAIVGAVVIIVIAALEIWKKCIRNNSALFIKIEIAAITLGAVLAVAMLIKDARKPIVSPAENKKTPDTPLASFCCGKHQK